MINPKVKLVRNLFNSKQIKWIPTRNGFGEGMVEAGEKNKNVVAITADLAESTRFHLFQKKFPERFVEAGIVYLPE